MVLLVWNTTLRVPCYTIEILEFRRLMQGDNKFKSALCYVARHCQKTKTNENKTNNMNQNSSNTNWLFNAKPTQFKSVFIILLCVHDVGAPVLECTCRGQRNSLWSRFLTSFPWVPEVELGLTRLSKSLCHLVRPQTNKHHLECIFLMQRKELKKEKHEGMFWGDKHTSIAVFGWLFEACTQ